MIYITERRFHPFRRSESRNRHAYWDGGPEMIESLLRQHDEGCRHNHYCGKLEMREAEPFNLASAAPSSQSRSTPKKRAMEEQEMDKKPLGFLLNSAASAGAAVDL